MGDDRYNKIHDVEWADPSQMDPKSPHYEGGEFPLLFLSSEPIRGLIGGITGALYHSASSCHYILEEGQNPEQLGPDELVEIIVRGIAMDRLPEGEKIWVASETGKPQEHWEPVVERLTARLSPRGSLEPHPDLRK